MNAMWVMLHACNFNCSYCLTGSHKEYATSYLTSKQLLSSLYSVSDTKWDIMMTGGEPFLYPGFVGLCDDITKGHHTIVPHTNLSTNNVQEFSDRVDPRMVRFICVSFHLEEREKLNLVEDFIERVNMLKKKGFKLFIGQILKPDILSKFRKYQERFRQEGFGLIPTPFIGIHNQKSYPDSYSEEEKEILKEHPDYNFEERPNFRSKGRLCSAGYSSMIILENGNVYRCMDNIGVCLGSIQKGFSMLPYPRPCELDACSCPAQISKW